MEKKGRLKVTKLLSIEEDIQKNWAENHIWEVNAPVIDNYENRPVEKFFTTFPFPYMNGKLHLGHSFSLSKCEFAVRYNSLKGKLCLFPFGFHCTGMPIKACADKLQREIEIYGLPPKFPGDNEIKPSSPSEESQSNLEVNKAKGKKSKSLAKGSGTKYQWQIMQSMGFDDRDIPKFSNTNTWLEYFPTVAKEDLKRFGLQVDWRRSFITTDVNPFFSSFVKWQFNKLFKSDKIKFGKRYTIYSSLDGQPCMDHDRSVGEGVGPQEYTLIKLRLVDPFPASMREFCDNLENIYLVAATLRPETMYGQTNVWAHPDIKYICFKSREGYLICTLRSANNMAHQGFTEEFGVVGPYIELIGDELIGLFVSAPMRDTNICVLPMRTIKDNKGTGIVTSVPSDSPDDYINLLSLKNNPSALELYGISKSTIDKCKEISVINVPGLGNLAAVTACEQYNVQSPDDRDKLQLAKELVYTKGFYEGVMQVGKFHGFKVKDAKKMVQQELIDNSYGAVYYEPEKTIISRSGDECVVALCDQWFLDYGESSWKALAEDCLNHLETFHEEVRKNFNITLDWLHEHACARSYGLGTRLPWDDQWLIESLSDSTIYMAYYTISHFLENQTNSIKNRIKPEYLTQNVWDYIFGLGSRPSSTEMDLKIMDQMRNEFLFWYPVDVRCSGKDLIQNHLTYFIYNHTAIWPEQKNLWPKAIRANGHLLLNSQKMSKSEGNFLTLKEALTKYGADGTRLALADAGDSIEDANFSEAVADAAVLRLFNLLIWVEEVLVSENRYRKTRAYRFQDQVFMHEIFLKIKETDKFYERMLFKEALRTGFYEMQNIRDKYRDMTGHIGMHWELLLKWIHSQAIMLYPICPHTAEYIINLMNKHGIKAEKGWPVGNEVDYDLLKHSEYLMNACRAFRIQIKNLSNPTKKGKEPKLKADVPLKAIIYVAKSFPPWQAVILKELKQIYDNYEKQLPDNKIIANHMMKIEFLTKYSKRIMPFVQYIKDKFNEKGVSAFNIESDIDEINVLRENSRYIKETLHVVEIVLRSTEDEDTPDNIRQETSPYSPYLVVEQASKGIAIPVINPEPRAGFFTHNVTIRNGMTVFDIKESLDCSDDLIVSFWRWNDPILTRVIPAFDQPYFGKSKISDESEFKVDEENDKIYLSENSKLIDIGKELCYFINSTSMEITLH